MSTVAGSSSTPTMNHEVELAITGMTCASCANRIERKLNKLDGVTATVNYATEKAKVVFPVAVAPEDLVRTVEQAGYGASLPQPESAEPAEGDEPADPTRSLRQRLLVSAVLSVPVVARAMVPAWRAVRWFLRNACARSWSRNMLSI